MAQQIIDEFTLDPLWPYTGLPNKKKKTQKSPLDDEL